MSIFTDEQYKDIIFRMEFAVEYEEGYTQVDYCRDAVDQLFLKMLEICGEEMWLLRQEGGPYATSLRVADNQKMMHEGSVAPELFPNLKAGQKMKAFLVGVSDEADTPKTQG